MYYSSTKRWTSSVQCGTDRTPYYGPSARSPKDSPYMGKPGELEGKHDAVQLTKAIGMPLGDSPLYRDYQGQNIGAIDEVGQVFYKSKNGPGDRGEYSVSSGLRNRDTCRNDKT